ncbi:TPA: hypothetical protein ACH3X2_006719 [Trebouxia sp. C0005]
MQNEELVAAVLGHIFSLRDLLRCSAVSRCWHSATKILRPTSIEVPGVRDIDISVDDDILKWLQQKHQQQYFDKLQNFSMLLSNYAADEQPLVAASGLAMLMLAGLWPLKACSIGGPSDLYQIAVLLPDTLHHLHVQLAAGHRDYHRVDICIFQRFRSLRSLHLRAAEKGQVAGFHMHLHIVLPNLRHLHLSPSPFKDNGLLANSLPQLTHAALHIEATDFKHYVTLPQIEYLAVQLVNSGNEVVHVMVRVNANSHLKSLILDTPENVKLDFCLDKPDLLYWLRGSGGIRNVCSQTNLNRLYQLPKHFHLPF